MAWSGDKEECSRENRKQLVTKCVKGRRRGGMDGKLVGRGGTTKKMSISHCHILCQIAKM